MEWGRTRIKHLASIRAGSWGVEPGEAAKDVYCVRAADFDRNRLRVSPERLPVRSVDPLSFRDLSLKPGDIVLEKSGGGPDQPVGASVLFELDVDAVPSNFAARVRPLPGVDPRFLNYLMAAIYFAGVTRSLAKQTTGIANLDVGAYMAVACSVPGLEAQIRIADFLDHETARIDQLARARSRQIELLVERQRSFHHGLLVSSAGTSWRLSHLLIQPISDGPHETPEFLGEGVPFLSVDNVVDDRLSFEGCRRVSAAAHAAYARKSSPRRGDVLITKAASIGRAAVVETDEPFSVWSPLAILRPNPDLILSDFLHLSLLSSEAQAAIQLAATSNTQQNISMRDLSALRLRVPPLPDQRRVVDAVRIEMERLRGMKNALLRQRDLLAERRKALITAAVTGKLEMPGVAA